ncbi:MAG: hypothetical protein JWO24_4204 [Rhodospirillales bacterium]|jgi:hypothetical protein|nr:hypothetical protein [Rhodospirillales bacterium]
MNAADIVANVLFFTVGAAAAASIFSMAWPF